MSFATCGYCGHPADHATIAPPSGGVKRCTGCRYCQAEAAAEAKAAAETKTGEDASDDLRE